MGTNFVLRSAGDRVVNITTCLGGQMVNIKARNPNNKLVGLFER